MKERYLFCIGIWKYKIYFLWYLRTDVTLDFALIKFWIENESYRRFDEH